MEIKIFRAAIFLEMGLLSNIHPFPNRSVTLGQTEEERLNHQQKLGTALQRRLSCRPTVNELKEKNIIVVRYSCLIS